MLHWETNTPNSQYPPHTQKIPPKSFEYNLTMEFKYSHHYPHALPNGHIMGHTYHLHSLFPDGGTYFLHPEIFFYFFFLTLLKQHYWVW